MANESWFYSLSDERKGPVDLDTLKLLIVGGTVKPNGLVWKKGMDAWSPAAQVDELKQSIESARPRAQVTTYSPPALPGAKKVSNLSWIIGGAAVAVVGGIIVLVIVLAAVFGNSGSDGAAEQQRSYDEQLSKDAQDVRDAFKPAQ